eukprot:scaffold298875_cov19-Prasinocladus_malaysianus.AAC.1
MNPIISESLSPPLSPPLAPGEVAVPYRAVGMSSRKKTRTGTTMRDQSNTDSTAILDSVAGCRGVVAPPQPQALFREATLEALLC